MIEMVMHDRVKYGTKNVGREKDSGETHREREREREREIEGERERQSIAENG